MLMERVQLPNYNLAIRKKDGDWFEADVSLSFLRNHSGAVVGTLAVTKDITEQKRAEEALNKEKERSDALYQVSNMLAGAHDTDEVLDLMLNEAARLVGANSAYIRLLEGDSLVMSAATETAADFLAEITENNPRLVVEGGSSFVGHVMATKKPLVMEDATKYMFQTPIGRQLAKKYGFRGAGAVPLLANDRPSGVLVVADTRIRLFTDDEVSLLTAFADQAALALEKARLLSDAEREKDRAETENERSDALYRVSNRLAGVHDTDEVLDLNVNEAVRLVGANAATIQLLKGEVIVPIVATESAADFLADLTALPTLVIQEATSGASHVLATKKPLVSEDVTEGDYVNPGARLLP